MSGAFGNLFGKKAKAVTQPTSFETRPEFARQGFEQAVGQARAIEPAAFGPTPFNPQQLQAQQFFGQQADIPQVTPEAIQAGISTFQNPFEEQVVQNALRDLRTTGQGQFSDISQLASSAGGFGGTRQALLESELFKNLQQGAGDISGQLRSQGFQNASQRALEAIGLQQQTAALGGQRAGGLFDIGSLAQQQATQRQQAPINQAQFLANLTSLAPTGGGQTTFAPPRSGAFQKFGSGLQAVGKGFGSFGDQQETPLPIPV